MLGAFTTALPSSALPAGGAFVVSVGADILVFALGAAIAALAGFAAARAFERARRMPRALRVVRRARLSSARRAA
jgi:hypothetical protein